MYTSPNEPSWTLLKLPLCSNTPKPLLPPASPPSPTPCSFPDSLSLPQYCSYICLVNCIPYHTYCTTSVSTLASNDHLLPITHLTTLWSHITPESYACTHPTPCTQLHKHHCYADPQISRHLSMYIKHTYNAFSYTLASYNTLGCIFDPIWDILHLSQPPTHTSTALQTPSCGCTTREYDVNKSLHTEYRH